MPFRASVASVFALLLLVGCGSEDEASPGDSTPPTVTEPIQTIATVPETAPAIVTVYFLRDGKVGAASRAVVAGPQIGRAAITELLEGPARLEEAAGMRTSIPSGTQLEGLSISTGLAEVELSNPLDAEASAQVVYTLTQFPTVRMVSIEHMQPAAGPTWRSLLLLSSSSRRPSASRSRHRSASSEQPTRSRRRSTSRSWTRKAVSSASAS